MTYGVDECRRCGKPMRVRRDNPKKTDNMPSNLSEAEWRAQGWLAKPTKTQQIVPSRGCCTECATMIIRSNWKPGVRISAMFGAIIAFVALAYWLMTIFLP